MRDFTLKLYKNLLRTIHNKEYEFQTFEKFALNPSKKVVVLRHDSDIWPRNDLKMAELESEMGIKATYYFRIPKTFKPAIIKKISKLGHEIGYHYEDLVVHRGDVNRAIDSFRKNLNMLRQFYPVKTVSMHGRPLSIWDNRDLFKQNNLDDFGLIADPYLSIDYSNVLYLTDNGNRWDGEKSNIRDSVASGFQFKIKSTYQLIEYFNSEKLPDQIIINAHPARWNDNFLVWLYRFYLQKVKNVSKTILKLYKRRKH
jgi:hypothetical protein